MFFGPPRTARKSIVNYICARYARQLRNKRIMNCLRSRQVAQREVEGRVGGHGFSVQQEKYAAVRLIPESDTFPLMRYPVAACELGKGF
jgi:hypothetical protein